MKESTLLALIRNALGRTKHVRAFRNNCGTLKDERGHFVSYGVPGPGGSDLIGWVSIHITPDMVGHKIACFLAIETKSDKGRVRPNQENFIEAVRAAGGCAGIARTVEAAEAICKQLQTLSQPHDRTQTMSSATTNESCAEPPLQPPAR